MMADKTFKYYGDLLNDMSVVDAHVCRLWKGEGGTHI